MQADGPLVDIAVRFKLWARTAERAHGSCKKHNKACRGLAHGDPCCLLHGTDDSRVHFLSHLTILCWLCTTRALRPGPVALPCGSHLGRKQHPITSPLPEPIPGLLCPAEPPLWPAASALNMLTSLLHSLASHLYVEDISSTWFTA